MRFSQPAYLLLLIPAIAGLIWSFRHVHGIARARKRLAFALRFLLTCLLIGALAGPESYRPNRGLGIEFIIDHSDSVGDDSRKSAEKFVDSALRSLGPNDAAGVVVFGKEPVVDAASGGARPLNQILTQVDPAGSNLAGAVRLASAMLPEGKARRIVVLTDGNETEGDGLEAAQVAATDHIQIDHVVLAQEPAAEAVLDQVEAPSEAHAESPFDLRINVESNQAQTARVDLDRDGVLVKQVPVSLEPGQNSIVISDRIQEPGFHRYRATVRAQKDKDSRNNVGMAFVAVRGKSRLLVLQKNPEDATLAQALQASGIDVVVQGPGQVPVHPEDLQAYDAVVLNDYNADSMTEGQMKLIQAMVRDSGIGFAMVGGENSFLPGGYFGTPVAEVLPVDLNIRQRKTFPKTSILIVCDASGSMGMLEDGIPKIRLAAQAAEKTVELMSPRDRVGVAGSTDGIEFVAPMQDLTDKNRVIAGIRKLEVGGGGIYIKPSMDFAQQKLDEETSKVRHLILLADGDDCDLQEGALGEALMMRSKKITTTVVAIGTGKDVKFLQNLAMAGGGRYYLAKTAKQLPAIFTQDAAIMSRSAIQEGAFYPKLAAGEPVLKGIDSTPPLLAYCISEAKPLASVGMKTGKDDPLLATWQYGLGTSLAFTSDAQPRWAKQWLGWPQFSAFWSQVAREITRRATKGTYQVGVQQVGGRGQVDVTATDALGYPLKSLAGDVHVTLPDGSTRALELSQTGPGKYQGSFDATQIGSYIVTVAEADPQGGTRVRSSGFSVSYPAEYRSFRPNTPLLDRMSSTTGGKALLKAEEALRPIPNPGVSITDLWSTFLLFAALLLPFDVGVRRIALPLGEILAKLWARIRQRKAAPVEAILVTDRLKAAKERARGEYGRGDGQAPAPMIDGQPPREPRAPVAASTGTTETAKRLLAAKKQRRPEDS